MLVASYFAMACISITKINQSNQKVLYPTRILNNRFQIIGYSEMLDHGQPWISRKEARIQSNSFKRKINSYCIWNIWWFNKIAIRKFMKENCQITISEMCVNSPKLLGLLSFFISELLYFKDGISRDQIGQLVFRVPLNLASSNRKSKSPTPRISDSKLTSKYLVLLGLSLI